ncbi:MAG: hypothetical protein PHC62_00940 [Candidatus Izemoplasmatales bacterium]|nr:hypothetical protein [Candidatus Izemoplasmatales bacterium]
MSNRRSLKFTDIQNVKDSGKLIKRGHVQIYSKQTGKLLFEGIHHNDDLIDEGDNKVIVPGSILAARKFFPNLVPNIITPSYNDTLGLDSIQSLTTTEEINSSICLFAVGTDGCGIENSQVYDVDYTKWINPSSLVPFRYQPTTADLSSELRQIYYGRKAITASSRAAYYFKAFNTNPELHIQYLDGTNMDENLYNTDNNMGGEVFVQMKMSIEPEDCRDYFKQTTGINSAKINTISLLTAYPKSINGFTFYQGIRPMTKYNFPNESLIDETKGWDIIYDLYF